MQLFFFHYRLEYEGEIFGKVLGENVYFQISWNENDGELKCKFITNINGSIYVDDFDGNASYHKTYAQCSKWPIYSNTNHYVLNVLNNIFNTNTNITLELGGKSFNTTIQKAIDNGRYPQKGSGKINFDEEM